MLADEIFPAASIRRAESEPPAATSACKATVEVCPIEKFTAVSLLLIDTSVAITVVPRSNSALPPSACPAVIDAEAVILVFDASSVLATTVPPTPVAANEEGADGGTVSTLSALFAASEPTEPGEGKVRVASLSDVSRMIPPFNESADVDAQSRSLAISPVCGT